MNNPNHQNLNPQSEINTKNSATNTALQTWTSDYKKNIFVELTKAQLVLKTYGKQSEDIKTVVNVFIEILSDFAPEKVIDAIKKHIRTSPEFPTPSDIIKILKNRTHDRDRPNHQVYCEICAKKRNGEDLTYSEKEYKKQYEDFYLNQ